MCFSKHPPSNHERVEFIITTLSPPAKAKSAVTVCCQAVPHRGNGKEGPDDAVRQGQAANHRKVAPHRTVKHAAMSLPWRSTEWALNPGGMSASHSLSPREWSCLMGTSLGFYNNWHFCETHEAADTNSICASQSFATTIGHGYLPAWHPGRLVAADRKTKVTDALVRILRRFLTPVTIPMDGMHDQFFRKVLLFLFPSDAFVASARSFNMFKSMLQLELID